MDETYYAVLGLAPGASAEAVEKAHRHCRALYEEGALATYTIVDAEERRAARARIDEAFAVLGDAKRRAAYDREHGLPAAPAAAAAPASPGGPITDAPGRKGPVVLPGSVTGAELRRFREARGVTLKEIATSSKIGSRTLDDIETERIDRLPPTVYLRGFVQEYAREIGLDPKDTAERYLAHLARKPPGS